MLNDLDTTPHLNKISESLFRSPPPKPFRHDMISVAVANGLRANVVHVTVDGRVLAQASEIVGGARDTGTVDAALDVMLGLVSTYPTCERLQVLAARLVDRSLPLTQGRLDREAIAAEAWDGVHARFPNSIEAFRLTLRWVLRRRGADAAKQVLHARCRAMLEDAAGLSLYANGLDELRSFSEADASFERLIALFGWEDHYLQFVNCLLKRGEVWRACRVLDAGIAQHGLHGRLARLNARAMSERARLAAFAPCARDGCASNAVLTEIFGRLALSGRQIRKHRRVGGVMMITGSLGAGGAERQFAVTARALHAAAVNGYRIAGYPIDGPVNVICRCLKSRSGADFFEPTLREAGLAIREYAELPPFAGRAGNSILAPFEDVLGFLPQPMIEGAIRLADAIRAQAPHVVHIWQDGSIFSAGVAALAAGVPRIVLNVRSLPPIDRPERYRPEYEVIFRGLLAARGVRLTANSKAAARRYAEWLAIDPQRIGIIYNGVDALPADGGEEEHRLFERFAARTSEADFTVGTVMRLDENKRPFLWLDAASRIAHRAPQVRFIVVGDGPLRADAVAYAARLGLAGRVLFVGRSSCVGFWLQRMDVFMLLSLVEGLPNVLIEAQHAGLPVIATDVGGAAETVLAKQTGLLLPPGEGLDPEIVAASVLALRDAPERLRAMGVAARRWVRETFSIDSMMKRTVRTFLD